MYDVTNQDSFDDLQEWHGLIKKHLLETTVRCRLWAVRLRVPLFFYVRDFTRRVPRAAPAPRAASNAATKKLQNKKRWPKDPPSVYF